ncbi:MAG: hypothetical protein F6K52_26085 [Moorea sp. SIO3H5]|nr:hypothetical protein [Moorena sp. SIO3H5]
MKLARCQFYQDASSTKMPVLPRCQFYQDASVLMQSASGGNHGSRSWGKPRQKLARCQFYARCQCLDAVAHGGFPQDRAASLPRLMPILQVRPTP